MKIAVCIKQIPAISMIKFDNETKRVIREGVPSEVNHFDVLATCAAVNLKKVTSAEVVTFTMGPPQAREALVQCIATGADRGIHLVDRAFAGSDTLATARALSIAIEREGVDLVLCGRNSIDSETGQVGPEIAEMLGIPQVTAVRSIEIADSGDEVIVERVTEDGYEVVRCPLPALLTVTEDVADEAFPGPDALESAQNADIIELTAADLSPDLSRFGSEGSPTWVNEVYSIESQREGILVRDKPVDEAVSELMRFLEDRGAFDETQQTASASPRGPLKSRTNTGPVLVVVEVLSGQVRPVSLELLGSAAEIASTLGTNVEAVLIGDDVRKHVSTLAAYGADRVRLADDPRLKFYDTETQTRILAEAIDTHRPYAVLLPSTTFGRDLAARVAARLQLGLTGDCIGLEIDSDKRLVQLKPAFGGNIVAPILSKTQPYMSTVRPGMLTPVEPDYSVEAEIIDLPLENISAPRIQVIHHVVDQSLEGAELENARVIVGVGMGIGGPEGLPVVRQLADALNASIGATRDVTDQGWLPRQYQIGLSGKSVSPHLYIAVALRGPFNHTVGIQRAGTVVAINNSRRSPIFRSADFGILGDYTEIVPVLTKAVLERKGKTDA